MERECPKRQHPVQLIMQPVTMRRVFGVLMLIIAGGYWYANLQDIDLSVLKLPETVDSPAFWLGYAGFTIFLMMPQLIGVPGTNEVNLLPQQSAFQNPLQMGMQMAGQNQQPFQMNGKWYMQTLQGYLMWDDTTQMWVHAPSEHDTQ